MLGKYNEALDQKTSQARPVTVLAGSHLAEGRCAPSLLSVQDTFPRRRSTVTQAVCEVRPLPTRGALALGLGVAALLSSLLPSPVSASRADYDPAGSYSYIRTLDGSAELISQDGESNEATIHQPILPGDRVSVARSSRLEAVLADGSLLRLDAGAEVVFESIEGNYGDSARQTRLRLVAGTLQLVVERVEGQRELPRIDTANATVHIQQPGRYLVVAEASDWTQVIVREGYAEVATERGSLVVRDEEQAQIEGDRRPRAAIEQASELSSLERWGESLEEDARHASIEDVDDSLRYGSSSMYGRGNWVQVSGHRRAWRPTVDSDWRPYREGFWRYTPGGYTWVSTEPWGWVPYHYGTWDYVPGHGWVWFPDRGFAPAWVYWYWGPDYVGWCPTGYYSRHYQDRYGQRAHFGVHGWAGGDWGLFADWNFAPSHHFGRGGQARRTRPSYRQGSDFGQGRLADGVITTDTRDLAPDLFEKPGEVVRALRTRRGTGSDLPNVTDFIARRELPPEVESQVLRPEPTFSKPANEISRRPTVRPVEEKPWRAEETEPVSARPRPPRPAPAGDWRESNKPEASAPVILRRPGTPVDRPSRDREEREPTPVRVEGKPDPGIVTPRPRPSRPPVLVTGQEGSSKPTLRPASPPPVRERPVRVAPPSQRPVLTPKPPPVPRALPPPPANKPKNESGDAERKAGSARPPRPPAGR